jgi:phosphotransacetylase
MQSPLTSSDIAAIAAELAKHICIDAPKFAPASYIQEKFGYSPDTLLQWEAKGRLQSGVHFIRVDGGHRRYNVALMEDRVVNWNDDAAHGRAVTAYLRSLPSNRKSK